MAKTRIDGKTKAERTKESIYLSAITLFREKGFDSVTVEEITQAAGTAKGSFYTYFSTKSDIIVEAFWHIDAYYRSLAPMVLAGHDTADRLLRFTEGQMRYISNEIGCDMLRILYANQLLVEGSDKVIIDRSRFWHTFIRDIIAEGQQRKEVHSRLSPGELAIYFNRSMRGMFLDWNVSSAATDLVEEALRFCREFVLPGMVVQG
ncbi:MAG: TetR/AcrR family transcriptional regulator [Sphaerochaetaceae bacterium]|nr:TetR/AcrR family transcriptional regulator [Sphaerochaetaceae bacterium]